LTFTDTNPNLGFTPAGEGQSVKDPLDDPVLQAMVGQDGQTTPDPEDVKGVDEKDVQALQLPVHSDP